MPLNQEATVMTLAQYAITGHLWKGLTVGHKTNRGAEAVADLALVYVTCQAVGQQVVLQDVEIILRRGLGARSTIARYSEHGWLCVWRNMINDRRDCEL